QALALPELPASLSIAGDDYIALELATLFARLGVRVKLSSPNAHLLAGADPAALRLVQAGMRKLGIAMSMNVTVKDIQERPLVVSPGMLHGIAPRIAGLHLDAASIQHSLDGGIQVDSQQRTSQPHIFAVGDCTGNLPKLASYAIKQGKVAAEVIAGQRVQFAPLVTPLVVHTTPEIALVGASVEEAASMGTEIVSGRFPLAANGRAQTLGAENGVAQIIASPDGTLLGATLVGPRAGDLVGQLALAIEMGATLTDVSEILYVHPGLSETVLEAAEHALGKAVHIVGK
ncbi:MAG: FAD-dependent oxidoreductase, partial [Ktedonobacteraceae bacterium]